MGVHADRGLDRDPGAPGEVPHESAQRRQRHGVEHCAYEARQHEIERVDTYVAPVQQDPGEGPTRADREKVGRDLVRSEEHTSELQSLMRISYAVFCLKKKK